MNAIVPERVRDGFIVDPSSLAHFMWLAVYVLDPEQDGSRVLGCGKRSENPGYHQEGSMHGEPFVFCTPAEEELLFFVLDAAAELGFELTFGLDRFARKIASWTPVDD